MGWEIIVRDEELDNEEEEDDCGNGRVVNLRYFDRFFIGV